MQKIFLLGHIVKRGQCSDQKHIGLYNSIADAEKIIHIYKSKEGFKNHLNGFYIQEFIVDEIYWKDGFNKDDNIYLFMKRKIIGSRRQKNIIF